MGMKSGSDYAHRSTIAWAAVAIAAISFLMPARTAADTAQEVKLNPGEFYVITGVDVDSTPEVRFSDNPNAFSVQPRSTNELLILAAHAGKGTVRVKSSGTSETYQI